MSHCNPSTLNEFYVKYQSIESLTYHKLMCLSCRDSKIKDVTRYTVIFSALLCITSRCLTFSIVYALRVCQQSDRYIVLPGILSGGQNIKTMEIKPMAYVNPYMKGGGKYEFKIRGKPKRRS